MRINIWDVGRMLQPYVGLHYFIDNRQIDIMGVYGGPYYNFFLVRWADTGNLFCADTYEVVTSFSDHGKCLDQYIEC